MIANSFYKKGTCNALIFAMVLYLTLWCISPPLFVNPLARIVALVCAVSILFLCVIYPCVKGRWFVLFNVVFLSVYKLIENYNQNFFSFITNNIQIFVMLLFSLIGVCFLNNKLCQKKYEKIFYISLLVYPVWMLLTLLAYGYNPYISRMLSGNGMAKSYDYFSRGIGGYGLVYSVVFLIPLLIFALKKSSSLSVAKKLLLLMNLLLGILLVFHAGFSIALLAMFLGIFLIVTVKKKSLTNLFVLIFILSFMALCWFVFQNQIVTCLTNLFQNTLYKNKVQSILVFLTTGEIAGSLHNRVVLYQTSWQLFLQNPLFGCNNELATGGHSTILDTFAAYGLLGGVPFLTVIFYLPIKMMQDKRFFGVSLTVFILLLFVGLTDTYAAAIAPIVYVLYPIATRIFCCNPMLKSRD